MEHHRADGDLPVPPARPGDEVLTIGCGVPTFTGTGYDLGHVSLHAVRVAVDLLGGGDGLGGQVHTLSLWRDGRPAPARWETTALNQHPACPMHERSFLAAGQA